MSFNALNPLYPKRSMSGGLPVASQSKTVSTAAVPFATAFNSLTEIVVFDVQVSDCRVRWDGTSPTGTVGHILQAGSSYAWSKSQAAAAEFIRISTASADAVIFASEFST